MFPQSWPLRVHRGGQCIRHNVLSGTFEFEGHSKNRLVALGMLELAKQLINREGMKQAMVDDMQKSPRIFGAKGFRQ